VESGTSVACGVVAVGRGSVSFRVLASGTRAQGQDRARPLVVSKGGVRVGVRVGSVGKEA